jgi:hypothetical protein
MTVGAKTNAGPSTALFAKCANYFAQDDKCFCTQGQDESSLVKQTGKALMNIGCSVQGTSASTDCVRFFTLVLDHSADNPDKK